MKNLFERLKGVFLESAEFDTVILRVLRYEQRSIQAGSFIGGYSYQELYSVEGTEWIFQ